MYRRQREVAKEGEEEEEDASKPVEPKSCSLSSHVAAILFEVLQATRHVWLWWGGGGSNRHCRKSGHLPYPSSTPARSPRPSSPSTGPQVARWCGKGKRLQQCIRVYRECVYRKQRELAKEGEREGGGGGGCEQTSRTKVFYLCTTIAPRYIIPLTNSHASCIKA